MGRWYRSIRSAPRAFSVPLPRPRTGRIRARYLAERHELAARYAEWEIIGRRRSVTWTEMRGISHGTGSQSATWGQC
jgi:hypothetical protein